MNNDLFDSENINENISISREVNGLRNEKIMTQRAVESQQNKWAEMLNGEMGREINGVLDGSIKIKIPFKTRMKYKIKNILKKFA